MKNYLARENFVKLVDSNKIWSKSMTISEVEDLLNLLEKTLENYNYESDKNFLIDGRRKGLSLEIESRILSIEGNIDNSILESLFNFWEYVNNEYASITGETIERLHLRHEEIDGMWNEYKQKGIICLEEKNMILEMIQMIKETINFQQKNNINSYLLKVVRNHLLNDNGYFEVKIKNNMVYFSGKSIDEITDSIIEFALDLVNDYSMNKNKYDDKALEAVKDWLDEEVDNSIIIKELGVPEIYIHTELGASLCYGSINEIGDHMPELRVKRNLDIKDVAING